MKSAEKARNNGLYRHIRTSKEIIRNLLNDYLKNQSPFFMNKSEIVLRCGIRTMTKYINF